MKVFYKPTYQRLKAKCNQIVNIKLFFTCLLFLLFGCAETVIMQNDASEITVNDAEIISVDQVIDSVNFLVLDTSFNAYMPSIGKFDIFNDVIYCFINSNPGYVVAFDINGHFLFKIDRVGRADNEWIGLGSFHIDKINNRLILCDEFARKVIITDLKGNFIKTVPVKSLLVYDVIELPTGELVVPSSFFRTGGEKNDYTNHKIHMFDSSGNSISSFLESTFVDDVSKRSQNELSMNNLGEVFYAPMFLNTIFKVTRDGVAPCYNIIYKGTKDIITDEYVNNIPKNGYRLIRKADEEKYTFYDGYFVDSERYVYVRMGDYYPVDVFYDKQTKETITTRLYTSYDVERKSCNTYAYQPPRVFYKGEWWAGISPAFLDIPQDYFEGEKSELYNEMRQIYDSHKEGCNMIVRYKLKNR